MGQDPIHYNHEDEEHEWWAQRERAKAKRKNRKVRIENMIGGSAIE